MSELRQADVWAGQLVEPGLLGAGNASAHCRLGLQRAAQSGQCASGGGAGMSLGASAKDLTARQNAGGGGMGMSRKWMCGHKHLTGQMRRVPGLWPVLWKCADCAALRAVET